MRTIGSAAPGGGVILGSAHRDTEDGEQNDIQKATMSRLHQHQQCEEGRQQHTREGMPERDTTRARSGATPEREQTTGLTEKRDRSEVRRQVGVLLGSERRDTEDGE